MSYIATVLLLTFYSLLAAHSWSTLSFGLVLGICGSLASWYAIRQFEQSSKVQLQKALVIEAASPPVSRSQEIEEKQIESNREMAAALVESQAKIREMIAELNKSNDLLHKYEVEKEQFQHRIDDIYHEFNTYKSSTEEELQRKTVLLTEYQETINQQREVLKKKQEQIGEFESKIHDLNYEVKTLIQLAELDKEKTIDESMIKEEKVSYDLGEDGKSVVVENLIKTPEEASVQLKRCIDIAQKITGANHFNSETSRFRDLSVDNYTLDLRRLFDSLRSENTCTIIVYSPKENKLLFANNQAKSLLGWSVDKFVQNFYEIAQESDQEWKKGLSQLAGTPESRVRLVMRTKAGQNLLVHCHLGMIPRGLFRNHVIGILYPA